VDGEEGAVVVGDAAGVAVVGVVVVGTDTGVGVGPEVEVGVGVGCGCAVVVVIGAGVGVGAEVDGAEDGEVGGVAVGAEVVEAGAAGRAAGVTAVFELGAVSVVGESVFCFFAPLVFFLETITTRKSPALIFAASTD